MIVWFSIYLCSIIHFNSNLMGQLLLLKITGAVFHWKISCNFSQFLFLLNHWHQCLLPDRFKYHNLSASSTRSVHALSKIKGFPSLVIVTTIDATVSLVRIKYIRFPRRRLLIHHLLFSLRRCHAAVIADILKCDLIPVDLNEVTHTSLIIWWLWAIF